MRTVDAMESRVNACAMKVGAVQTAVCQCQDAWKASLERTVSRARKTFTLASAWRSAMLIRHAVAMAGATGQRACALVMKAGVAPIALAQLDSLETAAASARKDSLELNANASLARTE